jgi:membrane fusion protein (multidrug efflux system)
MRPLPILAFLVMSVAVAELSGCGRAQGTTSRAAAAVPPAPVAIQKVVAQDAPAVYEYVGQAAGSREVEVRARVSGILLRRNFTEGGAVRQGQSLYNLDADPFHAALQRAEADVSSADARHAQAVRNLNRLTPLWAAKATSQRDYDDAVSAEAVTHADLQRAQALRTQAALDLRYTRVEAPISGAVGRSLASEGTLVSGPQVLLTSITLTDPIKIRFGVADTDRMRWRVETEAGQLKLPVNGAFDVEVKLADGRTYPRHGKLLFSDPRVSRSTGTVEAEAEIPNPDGVLMPGQFVRVRLMGAVRTNAVQVPTRAVLEGTQGRFVYIAQDGKAQARQVQVGDQLADGWIIKQGLSPGDLLIVDGTARIFFPGAPIRVASPESAASTAKVASIR